MKALKGILIAVLSVLIIAIAGFMAWMIRLGGSGAKEFWGNFGHGFSYGEAELANEQEIDVEGYESITLTYRSADLFLEPSPTGKFVISEYMAGEPTEENFAKIKNDTSARTLSVEAGKGYGAWKFFSFGSGIQYVKIGIPEQFQGELNIKTGSGNVQVNDVIAKEISIKVGSGDVKVDCAESTSIRCVSGSGDLDFCEIKGNIDTSTGSGDVTVNGAAGNVNVETGSGEQQITNATGNVSAGTGSGEIYLEQIGGEIDARTGSGDIYVTGLEEKKCQVRVHVGSGDIGGNLEDRLSFSKKGKEAEGTFGENPQDMVYLDTGSGDVILN